MLVILLVATNGGLVISSDGRLKYLSRSLSEYVLLTDDRKLVFSCLCKYVSGTALCNKWAFNNFESWRSRVAVEESFPNDVLSIDNPKVLCSCISMIWKRGKQMDRCIR